MDNILSADKVKLGCIAIGAIAVIVSIGMATGHNSVIAGTGMAVIGAIMGAVFGFSYGYQVKS